MMKVLAIITIICLAAVAAIAQSGRVGPAPTPAPGAEIAVKQLFDEANAYTRVKFEEYQQKKVPYSDSLLDRTKLEQRQLAAKYAAMANLRSDLAGDDLYYLGMLHWIADNLDGAVSNLTKFLSWEGASPERAQSARSIAVIGLAKQKRTADAEKLLADYSAKTPIRPAEVSRMESEMAKAYQVNKDPTRMAPHAEHAYATAKDLLKGAPSRATALDEILDSGMLVFEAYRDLGDRDKAVAVLDDVRNTALAADSTSFYYFAADRKITYLIETGRKPMALAFYRATLESIPKSFADKGLQEDLARRFKSRETHYQLLGERAPELTAVDQWFPGEARTIADYRGKVLMLDFWATWCGPCYSEFPEFKDWLTEFGPQGFDILGITRYYSGEVDGVAKEKPQEIEFLKGVRTKEGLPFDIVVARDQSDQILYGGTLLPTVVLIDRHGIVRYIGTGANPMRIAEMRAMIEKLMAEK